MKKDKRDHIKLICDIGELSGLFSTSANLDIFLQKTVEMVAQHVHSDVCSIYLYYEDSEELRLKATTGLNKKHIGDVRLKLGEGLTGLSLKEFRPICERNASQNSSFRYFPGLGEENYESFLAVPIIRGHHRIGVIVIQNTAIDYFTNEDINVMQAITSQLANMVETTRFIMALQEKPATKKASPQKVDLKFIKGKAASPGLAMADSMVVTNDVDFQSFHERTLKILTIEDFNKAVDVTEKQLSDIQKEVEETLSDVDSMIFSGQILMLKDKNFIGFITTKIQKGHNPLEAVEDVVMDYVKKFDNFSDKYLRERSQDIRDIGKRLVTNLIDKKHNVMDYEDRIIIAEELFASDIMKLYFQKVKGIILLSGGVTSHLSILSRSLQIPVIIADEPGLLSVSPKALILMDADLGNIYVNPSEDIVNAFKDKEKTLSDSTKLKNEVLPETYTKDGIRINLLANINLLSDVERANNYKAEGIGLYRTEFPFIVRSDFPSEEEQYLIYKKLVDRMKGKEITFRTLDIGGDKVLSYFDHHLKEANPFLGMRSIRFSLRHIDIFSHQLRAILRAGVNANIRIMFPMISSLDEFSECRDIMIDCIASLKNEGIPCNEHPKVGPMIELPAILEVIDEVVSQADFFSVGTNDLIQYILAIDRTNEKVADLYLPHHPSILKILKRLVDFSEACGKELSICGDMVHDERYLNFLVGIGIRKLSLNPNYIPRIQKFIMGLNVKNAQCDAQEILKEKSIKGLAKMMGFSN